MAFLFKVKHICLSRYVTTNYKTISYAAALQQ